MSALPTLSFPYLALSVACFRASSTFCPESKLARAVIAVLFHAVASFARRRALMLSALVQHVPLGKPLFRSVLPDLVGMNVLTPVDPGPPPGGVVDVPPNSDYESDRIDLRHGDVLVLYTEGAVEAENQAREQYSATRLAKIASMYSQPSADELVETIYRSITEFRGTKRLADDRTLVVLKTC